MTQNVPKNRPKTSPQIPQMLILGRWGLFQDSKNPSRPVTQKVVRLCSNHFPSKRPSRPENPDRRKKKKKKEERKKEDFSGNLNNLLVRKIHLSKCINFLRIFYSVYVKEVELVNFAKN